MDNVDMYITANGHLIIKNILNGEDMDLLLDFNSSTIPSLPEVSETTTQIPGRDGDIVLSTSYLPLSFNLLAYTPENLTTEQKRAYRLAMDNFLNTIKQDTKKLGFETGTKYYDVKYSGALTTTNYPMFLTFSIPLKSSEPFGKVLEESSITGNNSATSETIKSVGAIFTITGPAQTPIIYFNDYEMSYSNTILEGQKLVINSKNSTITHINSSGVETNVMAYYNHQFPKVQNGTNTLKVSSGIDDETQVTVKWNDLTF